jgi:uncharacterized protein YndB with AHSA1/START domain
MDTNDLAPPRGVEQIAPTTLRVERMLKAPIDKVWAYLTESEKRAKWFAGGPFDLRVGGKTELRFDHDKLSHEPSPTGWSKDGMVGYGEVTAIDPPRLLAWRDGGIGEGGSDIRFELTAQGDVTHVVITHTLAMRKDRVNVSSGWNAHLNILEDVLAARAARGFWTMHAAYLQHYDRVLP